LPPGHRGNNVQFEFQGKIYTESEGSHNLQIGDKLLMKHLPWSDIFLFPDADNPATVGSVLILFIVFCGICCLYYAFKKGSPPVVVFGKRIGE
jgi:hypothetical protein